MNLLRPLLVPVIILGFLLAGCSGGGNIVTPSDTPQNENQILASFDASWDGVSDTFDITQTREASKHWNINGLLVPNYIIIKVMNWNPMTRIMAVRVTIENPTMIDVYDVRGTLIGLGDKKMLNPDDYTRLFDWHTPPMPNPFRAFAKDETNRVFRGRYADPTQYIKSEIYEIYFPSDFFVSYIISASYPGNAPEPYDFTEINASGILYETSGSLEVSLEVLDWQDGTASSVVIENNPVTGMDIAMTPTGESHWTATITNSGGAPPGEYFAWISAWDASENYPLYNKVNMTVHRDSTGWGDPIVVVNEGTNEILPRIVLRDNQFWVIYTDGAYVLSKYTTDEGMTWNGPYGIGSYPDVDTIHAVLGSDNCIYVQYQKSAEKYTYVSKYDGSTWSAPVLTTYHAMTLPPYSCDLGFNADGKVFGMMTGSWSTFGFSTTTPWDITTFVNDPIESFYNGVYSINDGFVQGVETAKFFFVHDEYELDWAWYGTSWSKDVARTGTDLLIEPAIAPESDGPYHGVLTVFNGTNYNLEYFRYDTLPPTAPLVTTIFQFTGNNIFHSISVDGSFVSILYDADGNIYYAESSDNGATFDTYADEIAAGDAMYSHVRREQGTNTVVAVYAQQTSGPDYDIFMRIKH